MMFISLKLMEMAWTSFDKKYQRSMVSSFILNGESLLKKFLNYQEGIRDTVLITNNQYNVPDWTYTNQKSK